MKKNIQIIIILFSYVVFSQTQIGNDIDGESSNDQSGFSTSISGDGNIIAIVAILNNGSGNNSGHTRVYQNISGNWIQVGNDIDGESSNDKSGQSVSLSNDGKTIVIGADFNNGSSSISGHVRVYDLSNTLSLNEYIFSHTVKIFPNPTSNEINIQIGANYQLRKSTIYDQLGTLKQEHKKLNKYISR